MTPAVPRQRVIPIGAWITAAIVFGLGFLVANFIRDNPPFAFAFLLIPLISLFLSGYILLVGYVYGDARRRGMRYVMWTLLAIFLANGIGIVLYFILREPLLGYCSRCGSGVQHGFAYCPRCGANVLPACPTCGRVVQPGWSHCAWCGASFAPPAPQQPAL